MRRHEIDVFSLVVGLFFVGTALIYGLADDPVEALQDWPLPVLLITVGVIGLAAGLTRRRTPEDPSS